MRLFIALKIPRQTQSRIHETLSKKIGAAFKVVEEENLHITLLFIGEKSEEEARKIKERFGKIRFKPFKIRFTGAGSFGTKVVWIGIKEGKEELEELARTASATLGIKQDKEFMAHLTIARNKRASVKEFTRTMRELEKEEFDEHFEVETIALVKSTTLPSGPSYEVISERTFSKSDSGS